MTTTWFERLLHFLQVKNTVEWSKLENIRRLTLREKNSKGKSLTGLSVARMRSYFLPLPDLF